MRIEITREFENWLDRLRDRSARYRIQARIDRLAGGNFGDFKLVGGGVQELRIDHGPGYRLYFIRRGNEIIVLLCGGDKASQERDIERAKKIAGELR